MLNIFDGKLVVQSRGLAIVFIICMAFMVVVIRTPGAMGSVQSSITSYGTIVYPSIGNTKTVTWSDGQKETIEIGASITLNGAPYPIVSWGFHWLPINNWEGSSISGLQTVLPQLSAIGIRVVKLYIPGSDLPSSGVSYSMLGQALDLLYQNKMWIYIVQDNQLRSDWSIDKQSLYSCPNIISFIGTNQQWANMIIAYSPENELENLMAGLNFVWSSSQLRNHVTWMHDALKSYLQSSQIGDVPITFPMCAGLQIDPHSGENNCKILVDASDIPDFHCYLGISERIE